MKKIYKIIASMSIFLIVLFVGVALVVGNTNKKANAGVIINETPTYQLITPTLTRWDTYEDIDNTFHIGFVSSHYSAFTLASINYYNGVSYNYVDVQAYEIQYVSPARLYFKVRLLISGSYQTNYISCSFDYANINNDIYISLNFKEIIDSMNNYLSPVGGSVQFPLDLQPSGANFALVSISKQSSISIAPCTNIYDLENKSFCLLYLSDISGIATAQMQEEITINWGFIDSTDNTLYSEYAPTISAQNLAVDDDTIIRIGMPLNNNGSAMDFYDISQKALLSTIDSSQGGATATAHIYGVYIWRSLNMIEWGLAEFDTTSTPPSGASMNYLTSTTRLYQYQNMGTSTMTCRISVSSNFNFITIKNQEQVDVSNVNAVIRQGGFLPAWSLYNWARGSHSGFTSGEQFGAAPYQQGQPGYNAIYQAGRQAGLNENIGTQNWFIKIFEGVDSFLNIRIFPNITFGVLLGIPFVISVVWFIIRSFRGGGGS